jgi:hypothetical protein
VRDLEIIVNNTVVDTDIFGLSGHLQQHHHTAENEINPEKVQHKADCSLFQPERNTTHPPCEKDFYSN